MKRACKQRLTFVRVWNNKHFCLFPKTASLSEGGGIAKKHFTYAPISMMKKKTAHFSNKLICIRSTASLRHFCWLTIMLFETNYGPRLAFVTHCVYNQHTCSNWEADVIRIFKTPRHSVVEFCLKSETKKRASTVVNIFLNSGEEEGKNSCATVKWDFVWSEEKWFNFGLFSHFDNFVYMCQIEHIRNMLLLLCPASGLKTFLVPFLHADYMIIRGKLIQVYNSG